MELAVPPALVRNVGEVWGEAGRRWLHELPGRLDEVARRWELELGAPFVLSYHWVVAVTAAGGGPAVLKLGVPGAGHLAAEAAALSAYDGAGAVRLLRHDLSLGATLLERAEPGEPASGLVPADDEAATAAVIGVLRRLHRPAPAGCPLPELAGYAADYAGYLAAYPRGGPLPRPLVERAAGLFAELCADRVAPVLLHGDLHHDNLLRAVREPWLAIDPHGLIGDPGFDVGALLYNPDPQRRDPALVDLVPRRVEQLADGLDLPVERVRAWGFVMAVLSDVWTAEVGVPDSRALDVALRLLPDLA